jgi:RNA polymerase sigma-70 factor, ECF subfamily
VDPEQTYRTYSAALFRYLVRLTGDEELAADAVQDAFIRLVERPPRGEAEVQAWLYRVATNAALERLRTQQRRSRLLRAAPGRAPQGDAPVDPLAFTEERERQQLVRRALDALSERDRTALLLRAQGLTHREIAAALQTTTESVGTILIRAMRKFTAAAGGRLEELR